MADLEVRATRLDVKLDRLRMSVTERPLAAWLALTIGPWTADAVASQKSAPGAPPAERSGLPFSTPDLGWFALAVVVLLVLGLALHLLARRPPARTPARAARERTDP